MGMCACVKACISNSVHIVLSVQNLDLNKLRLNTRGEGRKKYTYPSKICACLYV